MTSPRTQLTARAHRGLPLRALCARRDEGRGGAQRGGRRGAGFTIIELLVVVAIIIILLSILIVAVNAAGRTAARANTVSLLNAVSQGLERFKNDIGYYPPVLGPTATPVVRLRELFNPPAQGSGTYQADIQNWYSTAAIPDYLLGWDVGVNDGYGYPAQNESPPSGIRHPDTDGVWAGTVAPAPAPPDGSLASRNPPLQGRVYGPYFEIKDENLLGSTDGTFDALGNLRVFFPGDPLYTAAGPLVLCDYWGTPIRYFRKPYPPGALGQSHRPNTDINLDGIVNNLDVVPTLSDVYLLRPWSIKAGTERVNRFADADGKTASTAALDSAEFALFSPGPDRTFNTNSTVDPDEFNKDNIVEVGP
jgi:type II secretory pathway pseudopilin PulG